MSTAGLQILSMKHWPTKVAFLLVFLSVLATDLNMALFKQEGRVIEYDVRSYYAYLPALFVYDDIKLEKSDYQTSPYNFLFWPGKTADGKKFIKTTCGLSILYAPFFFTAHGVAALLDYEQNGYSEPYKFFLLLASIFYLLLGLDFVRRLMSYFQVNELITAIVIVLLGLGTNLFCYASHQGSHTHVFNFFLISGFLLLTVKWYNRPSVGNSIFIGMVLGLIALIRPTNVLIGLFFVLFDVDSWKALINRLTLLLKSWWKIIIIAVFAAAMWIPQIWYWKSVLGDYIFYSYQDEGFFFGHSEIINGLFSFQKGWFIYTPIMFLACFGLLPTHKQLSKQKTAILVIMPLVIYVAFSWWCWWYGGSFGQRPMVDYYGLMAIPLASLVIYVAKQGNLVRWISGVVALFFIWLNIFQTFQFNEGSLHHDAMTKEAYFANFGKLARVENFWELLDYPNYPLAKKRGLLTLADKIEFAQRKMFYFQLNNGNYLSADALPSNMVWADKPNPYDWERITVLYLDNEKKECVLLDHEGFYISGQLGNNDEWAFSQEEPNENSVFNIHPLDNGKVLLEQKQGGFLAIESPQHQRVKLSLSADSAIEFSLIPVQ